MPWKGRTPGVVTIAALAIGIGLLPLPYEYYMLLRIFLCGVCLYFLTVMPRVTDREKWVLTGLVILYNPVFPIEFGSKLLWIVMSFATVTWWWYLERRAA
jgi:hypothetical protein